MLGIHLEGPWLNPAKAGAQNCATLRAADPSEVIPYLDSGLIRLVAVAPEIKANHWLITACRNRGITVAAGHTSANYDEMLAAIQMGVSQVTHCFTASPPSITRPGPLEQRWTGRISSD
jgi:N-acetylglucosamine-6-phosphate deacetylase